MNTNARLDASRIAALQAAKEAAYQKWGQWPGIIGLGIGRKRRAGKMTMTPSIIVWVEEKLPETAIPPVFRIPQSFRGWAVDVECSGMMDTCAFKGGQKLHSSASHAKEDADPSKQSDPKEYERRAGTLGCFGYKLDASGALTKEVVLLTCVHVLATNERYENIGIVLKVGAPPSKPDRDTTTMEGFDAVVTHALPGRGGLDVGLGTLKVGTKWLAEIESIGIVTGSRTVTAADILAGEVIVRKYGITTLLTTGVVRCVDLTISGGGSCSTTDHDAEMAPVKTEGAHIGTHMLIEVHGGEKFADHGDSGSAVVDDQGRVVGFVFAISTSIGGKYVFADPIDRVESTLGVRIATATKLNDVKTVESTGAPYPKALTKAEIEAIVEAAESPSNRLLGGMAISSRSPFACLAPMLQPVGWHPEIMTFLRHFEAQVPEMARIVGSDPRAQSLAKQLSGHNGWQLFLSEIQKGADAHKIPILDPESMRCLGMLVRRWKACGSAILRMRLRQHWPGFRSLLSGMQGQVPTDRSEERVA